MLKRIDSNEQLPKLPKINIPDVKLPKDLFNQLLEADAAGREVRKMYEYSHMALAGLLPVSFLSGEGSVMTRLCDLGLGVALPFHSHVAMNAVISDYLPYASRAPARYGLMAASGITALGLLKLNLFGPGITDTIRSFWRYEKGPKKLK